MTTLAPAAAARVGRAMSIQAERVNTPRTLAEALEKIAELQDLLAVQRDQIRRLRAELTPHDVPVVDEQWVTQVVYAEHWRVAAYNVSRWCSAGKLPTAIVDGRERVNLSVAPPKPRSRKGRA